MTDRVAIVGSRTHPDLEIVRTYVRSLAVGTVVISGGAEGVDRAAVEEATAAGLDCVEWGPQCPIATMKRSGLRTQSDDIALGYRDQLLYRNTLIAMACTRMVVFPDGSKGGCWDAAREADRFLRPVEIRWADGRVAAYALGSRGKPARRTS